jgi:GT2 family glycosyltransferase
MYKFSFVILHYLSFKDTSECIDSILQNLSYDNYNIIVVDNASTNDSFDRLKEKYCCNEKIYFIKNEKNLGFARGNNVGYRFAKYKLNSDFIILLNNDTIIEQNDFLETIITKYEKTKFYLLGPDIIGLDGSHQNPQRLEVLNISSTKKLIRQIRLKVVLNYFCLDQIATLLYDFIKKKVKGQEIYYSKELTNVQVHGACLVFSPDYVKKFDGLYDKTFLNAEEDILCYTLIKENCKIIYTPEVRIIHKEYGSTNLLYKSNCKRRRFRYKNSIESLKIFLHYIENYDEEKYNFMIK